MKKEYKSNSYEETLEIGKKFGNDFKGNNVVALTGELGAGKTVLAKGIAEALEICDVITSPTFPIINEYCKNGITLYHIDLYRIISENDYFELGIDELISESNIILIEWADKFLNLLPKDKIIIEIEYISYNERKILITI